MISMIRDSLPARRIRRGTQALFFRLDVVKFVLVAVGLHSVVDGS